MLPHSGESSPEWRPQPSFPIIIGPDVSGVVEAAGEGVNAFSVGDEVYSMVCFLELRMLGAGAYAEFVTVPADQVALSSPPSMMPMPPPLRCRRSRLGGS